VRAWERAGNRTACVILAASRDEGYKVRERVFGPLLERGMDLYFLENAYYGMRRTPAGPSLPTVSDHILMTVATICEARALLAQLGERYKKLIVTGYSMGGHLAALTAAITPEPVGCAALATGASAAAVYTLGLLHWSVDFQSLASGYDGTAVARQRLEKIFLAADITQHPRPMRCDAAVVVGCKRDAYVLPSETERLHEYWKGSSLRWVDSGHFSALMTCRKALCDCVVEAADRL
jgi:predicted alpha/beta hydrolase family esterase